MKINEFKLNGARKVIARFSPKFPENLNELFGYGDPKSLEEFIELAKINPKKWIKFTNNMLNKWRHDRDNKPKWMPHMLRSNMYNWVNDFKNGHMSHDKLISKLQVEKKNSSSDNMAVEATEKDQVLYIGTHYEGRSGGKTWVAKMRAKDLVRLSASDDPGYDFADAAVHQREDTPSEYPFNGDKKAISWAIAWISSGEFKGAVHEALKSGYAEYEDEETVHVLTKSAKEAKTKVLELWHRSDDYGDGDEEQRAAAVLRTWDDDEESDKMFDGKSPYKKGTKKYNKHMAAIHAEAAEIGFRPGTEDHHEAMDEDSPDNEDWDNDVTKTLRKIVDKHQAQKVKFDNGKKTTVDAFTASAVIQGLEAMRPDLQVKAADFINKSPGHLVKFSEMVFGSQKEGYGESVDPVGLSLNIMREAFAEYEKDSSVRWNKYANYRGLRQKMAHVANRIEEGGMKQLSMDLDDKEMSDEDFKKKYKSSRADMKKSLAAPASV